MEQEKEEARKAIRKLEDASDKLITYYGYIAISKVLWVMALALIKIANKSH